MIKRIINTAIALLLLFSNVNSQETIIADQNSGCDTLRVLFTLNTTLQLSEYTSVEWDFGDGGTESNTLTASHLYSAPGTYSYSCTLNGTSVIEGSEDIIIESSPYAEFIFKDSSLSDTEYRYFFKTVYYQPEDGETIDYKWEFPDDGSVVFDSIATHLFMAEGVYEVILVLTDDAGCADTLARKIPVSRELMPPNVFSPNSDGINDYFEVTTQGDYLYTFRVFTRTGTQVHFSESLKINWDGRTIGGQEVPEGVYYYVIESADTPVETRISGFIHLFR